MWLLWNSNCIVKHAVKTHSHCWLLVSKLCVCVPQGDTVYAKVVPEVDERELEKMVNPIVQEYFEHGDTKEVQVRKQAEPELQTLCVCGDAKSGPDSSPRPQMLLKGLNLGPHKYEFSSLAVSLSLEGKASHRELTSRLLSDLSGKLLSQSDMARAFDKMLQELPDLILDTPEAPQVRLQMPLRLDLLRIPLLFLIQFRLLCFVSDVGPVHSQSHSRPHPAHVFPGLLQGQSGL